MPDVVSSGARSRQLACAILLGLAFMALVRPAIGETDCSTIDDYGGWFECEMAQAQDADALLNDVYVQVMERMDPESNPAGRTNLREAQRAWIAFRDKECHYRTDGLGSVRSAIHASCIHDLTVRRIEELHYYLTCFEGDLSCPSWH